MNEISVAPLNLQKIVTEDEIETMRELRKKGLSIPKIARKLKRSPCTVSYYLRHNLDEGRMWVKKRRDQSETCRNCRNLIVIGTGSQILRICRITKRDVDYNDPCNCGKFEEKTIEHGA